MLLRFCNRIVKSRDLSLGLFYSGVWFREHGLSGSRGIECESEAYNECRKYRKEDVFFLRWTEMLTMSHGPFPRSKGFRSSSVALGMAFEVVLAGGIVSRVLPSQNDTVTNEILLKANPKTGPIQNNGQGEKVSTCGTHKQINKTQRTTYKSNLSSSPSIESLGCTIKLLIPFP